MEKVLVKTIGTNTLYREKAKEFLLKMNLSPDEPVDETIVAEINKVIVGTCSYHKNIIKLFAVHKEFQGQGISEILLTEITNLMFDQGITDHFVFTKPENGYVFEGFGFKRVQETEHVALFESSMRDVRKYVKKMFVDSGLGQEKKAALVVNCNPFTKGHKYLIQKASEENGSVVVFVVQEDLSLFPYKDRLRLVKEGIKELPNVTVLPAGDYIISSSTFPTYFLHDKEQKTIIFQELDAAIFGQYIAPAFNITRRYIGTEPYSMTTGDYNKALINTLPKYEVEVILVERLMIGEAAVSASTVRKLIKNEEWDRIREIVPQTTYDYLMSEDAKDIIEKIKVSNSRH